MNANLQSKSKSTVGLAWLFADRVVVEVLIAFLLEAIGVCVLIEETQREHGLLRTARADAIFAIGVDPAHLDIRRRRNHEHRDVQARVSGISV